MTNLQETLASAPEPLPAVSGVPERTPPEESASPGGRYSPAVLKV